jgi:cation diffusion facilitator CzcD-associated flavoprotein CzcO
MPSSPEHSSTGQPRVIIIGAGASGLAMGIRLLQAGHRNFRIYEKAERCGGTWRENTYPNVACDVFSPSYAYSFETNPEWGWRFARGEEIQRYLERCERKYGLAPYIEYDCEIDSARWDGQRWQIRTRDGREDRAEVLVSAVGALHHPRYPEIPGVGRFAGAAFHTARWDHGVDLYHKRVGIIGTGSTAAQVVPGIVDKAATLALFQRTAQWVAAVPDKKYSESFKARRRKYRWLGRLHHWFDLQMFHWVFTGAVRGNPLLLRMVTRHVQANLASIRDPALRRKMTPSYPPACKRLVIAQDFYPAIQKDNVEVVSDPIDCIEPRGVRLKNGRLVELDVLVYSTGFWPYKVSMDIVGKDGLRLSERLEGSPVTYRTICVPGFPNFFTLFGPYSPIGNNSIIENSERQIGYVMKCLELIASGRVRSLDPKLDVALRLKEEMRRGMQGTVWSSGCDSWYLDANGDPIVYPFGLGRFIREMRQPQLDEFVLD